MKVISWNLAGRPRRIPRQVEMLASRKPDLVALQEVRQPGPFNVPWPERILSVDMDTPSGPLEVHTTHIPPGMTNGWIKIDMLECLYTALAYPSTTSRLLCGDFNTPQLERSTGEMVTWEQRINSKGAAVIRQHIRGAAGSCWDRGDRQTLLGLAAYDLPDISRRLHGYERQACSWYPVRKDPQRQACLIGRRFEHLLASTALMPESRTYLQIFRASALSDHAALEAVLLPRP